MCASTIRTVGASTLEILDPRGEVEYQSLLITERLDSLKGATVGLLDNSKSNADIFLKAIGEHLQSEYGVEEIVYRRKDKSPIPADSIADQLHSQCDAVVNAYGDCGSCTSWCVYDSIDLEKKGTPVATINSDEFVKLGQSEAQSLGMPGLPLVTVTHPMGDLEKPEVLARAESAIEEIVDVLTTDRNDLEEAFAERFLKADEELGDESFYCPI
ncbi:MAG: UGSC family (seleno)protein [Natronomonas sp.]|uniref:UGSC family (seleno)protein n=1 Tax=Natronomonas sp. TaxID=2184060 RepID=UPI002870A80A|nr:UGSC family (seleno)protein [Natronomonas sp.]MDR9432103.1 UGSC family (seleno)protein [Natronomonas sp.]